MEHVQAKTTPLGLLVDSDGQLVDARVHDAVVMLFKDHSMKKHGTHPWGTATKSGDDCTKSASHDREGGSKPH